MATQMEAIAAHAALTLEFRGNALIADIHVERDPNVPGSWMLFVETRAALPPHLKLPQSWDGVWIAYERPRPRLLAAE